MVTRTTSRTENHCVVRRALAGWAASREMPNNRRPASNTAKTGAQPWMKKNSAHKAKATVVSLFTRYLDTHQVMGTPRARLPQKAEELSSPCWLGERLRSALMEGSSNPRVNVNIPPVVKQALNNPITTQR